jgi:hypothetical protein
MCRALQTLGPLVSRFTAPQISHGLKARFCGLAIGCRNEPAGNLKQRFDKSKKRTTVRWHAFRAGLSGQKPQESSRTRCASVMAGLQNCVFCASGTHVLMYAAFRFWKTQLFGSP